MGVTVLYRARTHDCSPCPLKPKCCPKAPERKIPRRRYTESERARQLLREEGGRVLTLRQGDRVEKITAMRAAVRSLYIEAAKGKPAAQKMVLQLVAAEIKLHENKETPTKLDRNADPGFKMLTDSELDELERLFAKAWPSGPP